MKRCVKCGVEKTTGDFNKNRRTKDGLQAWCRPCAKVYYDAYRKTDRAKELQAAWQRQYRSREVSKEKRLKYLSENRERLSFQGQLRRALERGLLEKPDSCRLCKEPGDELKAWRCPGEKLKVHWLCGSCFADMQERTLVE